MIKAWVIGSGGLLGSALCRVLQANGTKLFFPTERFCWDNVSILKNQISLSVEVFAMHLSDSDQWEIYWSAGIGTMSSQADELVQETNALSVLLRAIKTHPRLSVQYGSVVFASSAGALYAGASDDVITEETPITQNSNYAREKLVQEDMLRSIILSNSQLTVLIARISTLYGQNSSIGKKQGLISHMARCVIQHKPIHIYVPFDTIRDYINVNDAAVLIVMTLRFLDKKLGVVTKIIASEKPTSVAEIVSVFKKVAKRSPLVVTSANSLGDAYTRRVQFRSVVAPFSSHLSQTNLVVGISQVLAAERIAYAKNT
ncbi:hypothetical protein CKO12_05765 [Chromatium okenii]|uniref:NAD-dependent epimerase/dehydratase family protein n=1 Tax=Chromatium okenii TaxID=61644 RepID=UPI001908829F|nr:NAD-dependent epimerase/dehydratase family protein [Chromatium okenii]MBK1641389.1 hypothetical protein [Chromatium okenii]